MLADDPLFTVRAAADECDIHVREARAVIDVDLLHLTANATPFEALAQHKDIAAVTVEVQELWIEMRDTQGLFAHSRSPICSSSAFAGHRAE